MGLPFQYAAASDVLPGIAHDVRYVVRRILERSRSAAPAVVETA